MSKYRKKPVVIEAEEYVEGMEDGFACYDVLHKQFYGFFEKDKPLPRASRIPALKTLEGWIEITKGDYIITGIQGERYPCKPDIFEATYDKVTTRGRTPSIV